MKLKEREIEIISKIIRTFKNNKCVEAIYLSCYDNYNDSNIININIVYNNSDDYCALFTIIQISKYIKRLEFTSSRYNESLKNSNYNYIKIVTYNMSKFSDEHSYRLELVKDLISGKILFDKLKQLKKIQDNALKCGFFPYSDSIRIENTQEIKKYQKKLK